MQLLSKLAVFFLMVLVVQSRTLRRSKSKARASKQAKSYQQSAEEANVDAYPEESEDTMAEESSVTEETADTSSFKRYKEDDVEHRRVTVTNAEGDAPIEIIVADNITHAWYVSHFGKCSKMCGPGYKYRYVVCLEESIKSRSHAYYCRKRLKPLYYQTCNPKQCHKN